MLWRAICTSVAVALLGAFALSCGGDEGPVSDPLPESLRRPIYVRMVGTVNPAFNAIHRASQAGELAGIPARAEPLGEAATALAELVGGRTDVDDDEKARIVEWYRSLAGHAEDISRAASDDDLSEVLQLIRTTREENCNRCHNRYRYRPVS